MKRGWKRVVLGHLLATPVAALLLGGCTSSLLPQPQAAPALFALSSEDAAPAAPAPPPAGGPAAAAPALVLNLPRASPGYDSTQIVYVLRPLEIEYFARSRWVDTPSSMLAPMMVRAIERSGAFHAVLGAPTAASAQLRLETELVRLQQEFFATRPSQAHLTLRATLVDAASRQVIARQEFDARVAAPTDDPYGGVVAAQGAPRRVLAQLAAFCAGAVRP